MKLRVWNLGPFLDGQFLWAEFAWRINGLVHNQPGRLRQAFPPCYRQLTAKHLGLDQ